MYENNRHNVGFKVVELLARKFGVSFRKPFFKLYRIARINFQGGQLFLVKPLTFMNKSGIILKDIIKSTKCSIDNLVIICDNLDLPPGTCRFKSRGSSGGQRGLASVIDNLGTENFKRIYIGIGRPGENTNVIDHVLGNPRDEELTEINKCIDTAAEGILLLLKESPEKVIAFVNRKNDRQQLAVQRENIKSP